MVEPNGVHWSTNFFPTLASPVVYWGMLILNVHPVAGRRRKNHLVQNFKTGCHVDTSMKYGGGKKPDLKE